MRASFLLGITLFAFHGALASDTDCGIEVTSIRKSGREEHQTYWIPAKTREECSASAQLYGKNFAPQSIRKKTVRMHWKGK